MEGFKSYKEQIVTEPFSPKLNCIGVRAAAGFNKSPLLCVPKC